MDQIASKFGVSSGLDTEQLIKEFKRKLNINEDDGEESSTALGLGSGFPSVEEYLRIIRHAKVLIMSCSKIGLKKNTFN